MFENEVQKIRIRLKNSLEKRSQAQALYDEYSKGDYYRYCDYLPCEGSIYEEARASLENLVKSEACINKRLEYGSRDKDNAKVFNDNCRFVENITNKDIVKEFYTHIFKHTSSWGDLAHKKGQYNYIIGNKSVKIERYSSYNGRLLINILDIFMGNSIMTYEEYRKILRSSKDYINYKGTNITFYKNNNTLIKFNDTKLFEKMKLLIEEAKKDYEMRGGQNEV